MGRGNVELRHLKYFQAIVSEAGFSRAAAKLRVAQPALSRQIRSLEQELSADLLVRGAKGVRPTPAGEVFLRYANDVLQAVEDGVQRAQLARHGLSGNCRVGVSKPVLWSGMMSRVITTLGRLYRDIELEIVETEGPEQWNRLLAGSLDLGVGLGPPSSEKRLALEPILVSTIDSALLAADHPLASRRAVSGKSLAPYTLLALSPTVQEEIHQTLTPLLERAGISSTRRVTYPTMQSIWTLVAAGRGWTLTSSHWGSAPEGTVSVPIKELRIPFHLSLMSQPGEDRAHVRTVMDAFRLVRDDRELVEMKPHPESGSGPHRRRKLALQSIDLRHLRYFATVVDTGGFGRGASQLGITQPALSRQIRNLETGVGVQLLRRVPGGLRVTPPGEVLRGEINRIEARIERLLAETRSAQRGMQQQLVIGSVTTPITARIIAAALRALEESGTHIEPHIIDLPSPEQFAALRAGRIDIGICHAYPEVDFDPTIVRQRLIDDVVECALLSRDHPLANREILETRDLERIPFLFMPRSFHPTFYDRVIGALQSIGLQPKIEREYPGLHTVWAMAARGHGWSLGFRSHREHPPENLVALGVRGLSLPWGLDLIWRRQESNSQVSAVVSALQQAR
jgi:DNA-binding transcriptional LysR family regulator